MSTTLVLGLALASSLSICVSGLDSFCTKIKQPWCMFGMLSIHAAIVCAFHMPFQPRLYPCFFFAVLYVKTWLLNKHIMALRSLD